MMVHLVSLPPRAGGLGLPRLEQESKEQHQSSKVITKVLIQAIMEQEITLKKNHEKLRETIIENRGQKHANLKEKVQLIDTQLPPPLLRAVNQGRDKGTSSWLSALPLKEQGLDLGKAEFRDALYLRYNIPLAMIQTACPCGQRFNVEHAMTCKRGGFVLMRHNNIRDTCAVLLRSVMLWKLSLI